MVPWSGAVLDCIPDLYLLTFSQFINSLIPLAQQRGDYRNAFHLYLRQSVPKHLRVRPVYPLPLIGFSLNCD